MLRIAVSLIFAVSLAAQGSRITINPPAPTSLTPVEAHLFVVCVTNSVDVNRVGNVIKIHVVPGPSDLCDPPLPQMTPVPIGLLPAGEYRIEVTVGDLDSIAASRNFVVRTAERRGADIHPFAVPVQPSGLKLRVTSGALINRVFIDGVEVPPATFTREEEGVTFPAPAHAPGLVNVEVEIDGGARIALPASLYYYDHTAPVDDSVFERILFPVLFESAGAHGSHWVSEAAIANKKPWFIETFNEVVPYVCIDYPCGERHAPGSSIAFSGAGYPQGVALMVPRAESENLAFSLRIRDTARQAEGYGTQVPVVRERDMFSNGDLTLLDIPVDARYRVKLRIYAFDSGAFPVFVMVDSGRYAVDVHYVPLSRSCSGLECEAIPWYGELDLPPGEPNERVNLYFGVGIDAPAWAFASITNNETQQVTIVTADGQGGRP